MRDTVYGWLVALKKKDLTAALEKSTKMEWDEWRAKIDLMDANLVGNNREKYLMAGKDRDEGSE